MNSLLVDVAGMPLVEQHQAVVRRAADLEESYRELVGAGSTCEAAAAGRRRLLERHHPDDGWHPMGVLCKWCSVGEARVRWPCVDYVDTVAGLVRGLGNA